MRPKQDGFSAIELLFVMLVLGVVAAIANPHLKSSRISANGAAAVEATTTFHTAQIAYRAGVGNSSFGSATALFESGFLTGELAGGRANGYNYDLQVSSDGQHFDVTACPAALNRSGNQCFTTDENGVIAVVCPPGQHVDPFTGLCVPDDVFFTFTTAQFIRAIDQASFGLLLPAARAVAHASADLGQQLMLLLMDTDHDGMLTFDEALNADVLGPALRPLIAPILDGFRRDLALGIAGEQIAPVPIATMGGDLAGFFDAIPPAGPPGGGAAKR